MMFGAKLVCPGCGVDLRWRFLGWREARREVTGTVVRRQVCPECGERVTDSRNWVLPGVVVAVMLAGFVSQVLGGGSVGVLLGVHALIFGVGAIWFGWGGRLRAVPLAAGEGWVLPYFPHEDRCPWCSARVDAALRRKCDVCACCGACGGRMRLAQLAGRRLGWVQEGGEDEGKVVKVGEVGEGAKEGGR